MNDSLIHYSLMIEMILDLMPVAVVIIILLFGYHFIHYLYRDKKDNSLRTKMLREWLDKR